VAKKIPPVEGMRLSTLALAFEASRAVIAEIPIGKIGTFTELSRQLVRVSKDKDAVKRLHGALDRLNRESAELGATTLVRPADHPLFTRSVYVPAREE